MTKIVEPTAKFEARSLYVSLDGELRHHFLVVQDRARDQVREVGHEQHVVREVVFLRLAVVRVGQVRDLRERVERDAERQDDAERFDVVVKSGSYVVEKEVCVLEVPEQRRG